MRSEKRWLAVFVCAMLLFTMIPTASAEDTALPAPGAETQAPTLTPQEEESAPPSEDHTPEPSGEPDPGPPEDPALTPEQPGFSFDTALLLEETKSFSREISQSLPLVYFRLIPRHTADYAFAFGGRLAVKATLFNAQREAIATFAPGLETGEGQNPAHFAHIVSLKQGASYYLVVQSARGDAQGSFSLRFAQVEPTPEPELTGEPAEEPTLEPGPTEEPTGEPAGEPTSEPGPTVEPAGEGTPEPELTEEPTGEPAGEPTPEPGLTEEPTGEPTPEPVPTEELAGEPTPEPVPTEELAGEPAPEPGLTEEPTREPTPETVPTEELAGEPTPEPGPTDESAGETAPEPSLPEAPEALASLTGEPEGKPDPGPIPMPEGMLVSSPAGQPFAYSGQVTKSMGYPQSAHPYSSNMNDVWSYGVPEAVALAVSFSTDTYVEAGYDFIYIYDGSFNQLTFQDQSGTSFSRFTGGQLAGRALLIQDGAFSVRLEADDSGSHYGFSVRGVERVDVGTPGKPTVEQCWTDGAYLSWQAASGADGYEVSRSSNGYSYDVIATIADTFLFDGGLTPGQWYSYHIRAFKTTTGGPVFGSFSNILPGLRLFPQPGAPAVTVKSSTSVTLSWGKLDGAKGYVIFRSTSAAGPYDRVKTTTSASFTDSRLTPAQAYFYKIAAYRTFQKQEVLSPLSQESLAVTLTAPSLTLADQGAADQAVLGWGRVQGAGGYYIHRSLNVGGPYAVIGETTGTGYADGPLQPGDLVYYAVQAYIKIGETTYTGPCGAPKAVGMLIAPVITAADAQGGTKVSLKWTKCLGAAGYTVYRANSEAGPYAPVKSMSGTSASITGLTPGAGYHFKVAAYKKVGGQAIYGPASASAAVFMATAPSLGSILQSGTDSLLFAWSAVPGAQGYELHRSTTSNGTYAFFASVPDVTSFSFSGIPLGQTYYYKLRAFTLMGGVPYFGPFSAAKTAQTLAAPTLLSALAQSSSSAVLQWTASPGASGYTVYQAPDIGGPYTAVISQSATAVTLGGLAAGTVYYFRVAAYKAVGSEKSYTPPSNSLGVIPMAAPVLKSVTQIDYDGASLLWDAVPGATGYLVLRRDRSSSSSNFVTIAELPANAASFEDAGLGWGNAYGYAIQALREAGGVRYLSVPSAEWYMKLLGYIGIRGEARSSTSVMLQWNTVSGATGYTLYTAPEADGPFTPCKYLTASSITISGLKEGTPYHFRVAAYRDEMKVRSYSPISYTCSVMPMGAPTLKSATQYSSHSALFTWTAVPGADGYNLLFDAASNGNYSQKEVLPNATSAEVDLALWRYNYKIQAYRDVGGKRYVGPLSNARPVQILDTPQLHPAVGMSASSVLLMWNPAYNADGYTVYRAASLGGPYVPVMSPSTPYATVTGLSPGVLYYFKVAAYVSLGGVKSYSEQSNPVPAMTLATPVIRSTAQSGPNTARITWDPVPGALGYVTLRSNLANGQYTALGDTFETFYEDADLAPGATYYYKVVAFAEAGGEPQISALSAAKSVTLMARAVITSAVAQNSTTALVKWAKVSGATGYLLFRASEAAGPYASIQTVTSLSATDTGLTPGATYYYKVAPFKNVGGVTIYGALSDLVALGM